MGWNCCKRHVKGEEETSNTKVFANMTAAAAAAAHGAGEAPIGLKKCSTLVATGFGILRGSFVEPYGKKKIRTGEFFLNVAKCCKMLQKHDFSNIFGRGSYKKCSIDVKFGMDTLEYTAYV